MAGLPGEKVPVIGRSKTDFNYFPYKGKLPNKDNKRLAVRSGTPRKE